MKKDTSGQSPIYTQKKERLNGINEVKNQAINEEVSDWGQSQVALIDSPFV
jgi:uncharacterized protein YegP (UPF0339 family)